MWSREINFLEEQFREILGKNDNSILHSNIHLVILVMASLWTLLFHFVIFNSMNTTFIDVYVVQVIIPIINTDLKEYQFTSQWKHFGVMATNRFWLAATLSSQALIMDS